MVVEIKEGRLKTNPGFQTTFAVFQTID
jgi:hypothetical protein